MVLRCHTLEVDIRVYALILSYAHSADIAIRIIEDGVIQKSLSPVPSNRGQLFICTYNQITGTFGIYHFSVLTTSSCKNLKFSLIALI
jgi:hypothetical protein